MVKKNTAGHLPTTPRPGPSIPGTAGGALPLRLSALLLASVLGLTGCSPEERSPGSLPADSAPDPAARLLDAVPAAARVAAGTGEPRSSGYWVIWSTCGEGSRAETAAANGGRAAGFILLDDLLQDPGVTLGDHTVATCDDGVAILQGSTSDPVAGLARQLLAAKLNVHAGSERCAASEELVATGDALLSRFAYDGSDTEPGSLDAGASESLTRVATLLAYYNSGALCR